MKVLLIGSGGREHAIAKKIAESKKITNFYCFPGNPGIETLAEKATCDNTIESIVLWSKENKIELIVCGPEIPLVEGLADEAEKYGIPVFGPKLRGAMLEGSKIYSKNFMAKYNVPTADYYIASDFESAKNYIETANSYPLVIKADGLAAGKGVKIAENKEDAIATIKDYMLSLTLGDSGKDIVFESFMTGEEMSVFYLTDGKIFKQLIAAKDYKRAYDNDLGENTGGMGCYAPHSSLTEELKSKIESSIMKKVAYGFEQEKYDYRGVLYVGLMLTEEGPKVVEFNCRFGDPETQGIMPLLESDILELFYNVATGKLNESEIVWKNGYAASIVIASGGYPGKYEKHKKITFETDMKDFIHAGTTLKNGEIVTSGGRVLNAVSVGKTKKEALTNAYELASKVHFDNSFYRKDIGS